MANTNTEAAGAPLSREDRVAAVRRALVAVLSPAWGHLDAVADRIVIEMDRPADEPAEADGQ